MVDRYLSPKFGINSFSGIRENDVYGRRTDGWRTNDGRPRDDSIKTLPFGVPVISDHFRKFMGRIHPGYN